MLYEIDVQIYNPYDIGSCVLMKKWVLALSLAASVTGLAACSDNSGSKNVVAETKAGDVTQDELYKAVKTKFSPQVEQALQEIVLTDVLENKYKVSDKEIDAKYKEAKDQLGEQFDMFLKQYNLDDKSFKEYLKLQLLQEKAASKDVKVTNDELKKYYESYTPDVKVRHILVKDEKTAKEVKAKLAKGEKFEDLAKKYSQDPGSAQKGGEMGWINNTARQSLVPEFVKAMDSLKVNEVSEPVKSQYGYHIIEVTDKKEKKSYDKMKDQLKKELMATKVDQKAIQKAMKRELKAADVKINDKDLKNSLKSITDPQPAADPNQGQVPAQQAPAQ
jgi:foldase protein PrsA